MPLSSEWNNEAYVSMHLVQEILHKLHLPKNSYFSHWYPEFPIKVPQLQGTGFTEKRVDFFIEDGIRYVNFLIEVKSAKIGIDANARFQLEKYLHRSKVKFGVLIDPFGMEIYELVRGHAELRTQFKIANPREIEPVAAFLQTFLDTIKMRTIAIHTSKGGVGKTTLVVNIAYELAKDGHRVLVVDLDDQANASLSLGVNKADEIDQATSLEEVEQILDSFTDRLELIDFLLDCVEEDFDYQKYLYPSSFNLGFQGSDGKIDVLPSSYKTQPHSLEQLPVAEKRLNRGLQKLASDYDIVIIDTPPTYNRITWNGVFAAQYIIIPSQMEYLSAYGIRNPIRKMRDVREDSEGARGTILGIVPMMTDNTKINRAIKDLVKKTFHNISILPEVKRATDIREASHQRIPLSLLAEQKPQAGSAAKQLADLTQEIMKRIDSIETSKAV